MLLEKAFQTGEVKVSLLNSHSASAGCLSLLIKKTSLYSRRKLIHFKSILQAGTMIDFYTETLTNHGNVSFRGRIEHLKL